MRLLACLLIGVAAGLVFGGWRALQYARRQDFTKAVGWLRLSAGTTALASAIALFTFLGWPWRAVESDVAEEVSHTVMESVDEVIEVPWLWFFKTKKTVTHEEPKEIKETITHHTTAQQFDPWLLPVMAAMAAISWVLELAILRFVWWARG